MAMSQERTSAEVAVLSGSFQLLKPLLTGGVQGLQVVVDHAPDQLMVDRDVLVGEPVAKADDLWCLFNACKEIRVSARERIESAGSARTAPA